jgi:2-polyprenyl-6-methoxyphenol hydroxylase-like FAD-dependent oxidoreductase
VLYRYLAGLGVDGYQWAYGTGAAAGFIPTNGGDTCVFVSTTPDRMRAFRRAGAEAAFSALLTEAAPTLAGLVRAAPPSSRLHGWAGLPGFVRRSWGPGWALVGDAGYFKDPITTHGMTDAMRDAELLAGELLEALTGTMPEPVALARYQATRNRLSDGLMTATDAVAAYDWDTPRLQVLLRRVSSAMTDEVEHLQSLPERVDRAGSMAESRLTSRR